MGCFALLMNSVSRITVWGECCCKAVDIRLEQDLIHLLAFLFFVGSSSAVMRKGHFLYHMHTYLFICTCSVRTISFFLKYRLHEMQTNKKLHFLFTFNISHDKFKCETWWRNWIGYYFICFRFQMKPTTSCYWRIALCFPWNQINCSLISFLITTVKLDLFICQIFLLFTIILYHSGFLFFSIFL